MTKKKSGTWVIYGNGKCDIYHSGAEAQKHFVGIKGVAVRRFGKSQTDALQKFLLEHAPQCDRKTAPDLPKEEIISEEPQAMETIQTLAEVLADDTTTDSSLADENECSNRFTYPPEAQGTTCVAYVDGSYLPGSNQGGAGIVLFYQGKRKDISMPYPDKDILLQYANLPCELLAVQIALYLAILYGATHIILCHDMAAINEFANDLSPTNSKLAEEYRRTILFYRSQMRVEFRKVKGHADTYHNIADKLSRAAANGASTM